MGDVGDAVSYTALALGLVVMIFLGALVFVLAARRGNRRFKWGRGGEENKTSVPQTSRSSARDQEQRGGACGGGAAVFNSLSHGGGLHRPRQRPKDTRSRYRVTAHRA